MCISDEILLWQKPLIDVEHSQFDIIKDSIILNYQVKNILQGENEKQCSLYDNWVYANLYTYTRFI